MLSDIDDHFVAKCSLMNLDNEALRDLGGALGLAYPKLKRTTNILDDTVAAWLRREDDVLSRSGEPTWGRLVEALERIGQRGVAEDIKKEKFFIESGKRPPSKRMSLDCGMVVWVFGGGTFTYSVVLVCNIIICMNIHRLL